MSLESHGAYVGRETAISIAINVAISLFFAWLVFGGYPEAPTADVMVDYVPQTFMIALMGSLVPTAITRRRVRNHRVSPLPGGPSRLPRHLFLRSLLIAVVATLVLGAGAALVTAMVAGDRIDFPALLFLKAFYGALVAVIVTPLAVGAALRDGTAAEGEGPCPQH